MRILIAHRSVILLGQLQRRLERLALDVVRAATELTEVYDFTEHNEPDCVLLTTEIADCPEFELLATLFRMLGVGCVVLGTSHQPHLTNAALKANPAIRVLPGNVSDSTLLAALVPSGRLNRPATLCAVPAPTGRIDPRKAVLIGSSTGGIDALMQILRHFHPAAPPTVIVQHTGGSFAGSLIRLLDGVTAAKVVAATQDAALQPGHIYLASGDTHHVRLTQGAPARIRLDEAPRQSGHRPSVDALFHSAVPFAPHITAALLTGMGRDGAEGITALRAAGARTFGQDEATCVVYGMPRVAKALGGIETELPINQIGPGLLRTALQRQRA
ncbi:MULTISPECIES: CheB methylesterase domain-containing protein [unclassified Yoonia]|uniref:CheB methylesterase domain-containing protein n=1 Tax=unclassified Yoonia TaxID=2629118 RepID=UPI002AFE04E3|nr:MULTISPECIES: CheB methylesterase domain-containing protein [unclassified Yoonia]